MTLHLTCAFEVITLPNERVIALFHHFFLQFLHIIEIRQKARNTSTSRLSVPCILQILSTFNLYSGRPRMGLSINNKKKVRQAMVKISRGGWQPPPPPPGQICQLKWLDHWRVNFTRNRKPRKIWNPRKNDFKSSVFSQEIFSGEQIRTIIDLF